MSKKEPKLHAVVCPKQKKVKILLGNKVVKEYNFKMDIPNKKVQRTVFVHDYNERCVADRDSIHFQEDTEWDEKTINEIKAKALNIYQSKNNQH